jgi:hypothetical protein
LLHLFTAANIAQMITAIMMITIIPNITRVAGLESFTSDRTFDIDFLALFSIDRLEGMREDAMVIYKLRFTENSICFINTREYYSGPSEYFCVQTRMIRLPDNPCIYVCKWEIARVTKKEIPTTTYYENVGFSS